MNQFSIDLMKELLSNYTPKNVLDVGSQSVNGDYRHLFTCPYTGMDITAGKNVDVVCADPYDWQEIITKFDMVISGQCLEHVPMPWLWIKEIYRVLKPSGVTIIIAPWQWHVHMHPTDCWRILPDGFVGLFEYAGLKMIETEMREKLTYAIGRKP